jgi:hypothetical protein
MIKANELRIGNWVQAPLGELMKVKQLGHEENSDFVFATYEGSFGQNGFEGIPLTEEILLKCKGVSKCTTKGWLSLNLCNEWTYLYFQVENKVVELSVNHHSVVLKIEYLHEIQNLVQSLTNEELTVNL